MSLFFIIFTGFPFWKSVPVGARLFCPAEMGTMTEKYSGENNEIPYTLICLCLFRRPSF